MRKWSVFLILCGVALSLILASSIIISQGHRIRRVPGMGYSSKRNMLDLSKCKQYGRKERRVNLNYFYYYKKRESSKGLLWCKVPKAGSTTLTNLLLRLAGVNLAKDAKNVTRVHRVLRTYYPRLTMNETGDILKNSVKFLVVRDPFERILSAYRDKLENYERDLQFREGFYYENYGKFMVPKTENSTRVPSWPEFITYLLRTSIARYDEHWMPITRLCSPCSLNYDFVVKLERFGQDIQFPLSRVGINAPHIGWSHQTGSANKRIIERYFNNLTLRDIKKLYSKYKMDFQLFGYTPYKYFRLLGAYN